ncbi:hypothetical protein N665_1322s0009 [Sinapis alba]|nr:hypothetical protein N665_1322s0009 [Sinapis alba]
MCGSFSFHMRLSVIFMFVFLFGSLCEALEHMKMDIMNDIGPNVQLGLHCKDKHTDFGPQSLAYQQHYRFVLPLSFFGTSLYFCHFEWGNNSRWFDIFIVERDQAICESEHYQCVWSIRPSGPCRLNGKEQCFPWNPYQH